MENTKPDTKICTECNKAKWLSEFTNHKKGKDGLRHWCKPCVRVYNKQRLYDETQAKYEDRFNKGDRVIAFCSCGDYYRQLYFTGTSLKPKYRTACIRCSKGN